MNKGIARLTEDDIVRKEIEYVAKKFGEVGKKALWDDIQASENRLRYTNAIPDDVAILWLREYFGIHYPKYAPLAIPIPRTQYLKNASSASSDYMLSNSNLLLIQVGVLFSF